MSEFFIYPLGLLGLTAIPIVVLIYLLRSRYKSKGVSSTFIWKRSLKYVKRRIPLNFIMSLLLVLQILIVVAASFAIARPTIEPFKSEEKIVIIDASASMLALEGEESRFDLAKKKIAESAEEIGENHRMSLILAGEEAVQVVTRTDDKGVFLTALNKLECTLQGSNMDKALETASSVLNENKSAQIVVYTDKTYIDTDGIEVIDCKRPTDWNAGIISFEDEEIPSGHEFVVNVGNYGATSEFNVKLLINDQVVSQRKVKMLAGEIFQLRFTHSSTEDTGADEIRVRLNEPIVEYEKATVELSAKDSFSFDDFLTIYPKEKKNPKIMYVSKYVVVEGGKKNANKSLLNFAMKANGYSIKSEDMYNNVSDIDDLKGYDLYIFEGLTPYYLPTDGAVWLIDAGSTFEEETGLTLGEKTPINDQEGYLITKSLSLDKIVTQIIDNVHLDIPLMVGGKEAPAAVMTYRPIMPVDKASGESSSNEALFGGTSFRPIYNANDEVVFVAGYNMSVPMVITSFDFSNSSLLAYIADFPVLIKNMINFSVAEPVTQSTAEVGDTINFRFPVGAKTISCYLEGQLISQVDIAEYIIAKEEEAKKQLEQDPEYKLNWEELLQTSIPITDPGKYEIVVTFPDGEDTDLLDDVKTYAISSHLSTDETSITERVPTESLKYPKISENAIDSFERIEIFPYVIAVLIALLIMEWGVYYREQY